MSQDTVHIEDILYFCNEVRKIVALGFDAFIGEDLMPRWAMERCLQNIGEAANRLSQGTTDAYPHIPWPAVVGLRNVIAHEYDNIDYNLLWQIATVDVPRLVEQLPS
ncbi:DUF86 domain-containing protein [Candidatus Spongiisocius sp.]|uniref:HepT-like ribonuclease domain-containing protein n=1 Tax=Candidatus Spongiisocius sp. TaxID=3101273 RepID=UPI003B5B1A8E